jgi:predicted RecB family nuclease
MPRPIAITSLLVEAHLKCPTKCWLLSRGESGSGNTYADWMRTQHENYRAAGIKYMTESITGDGSIVSTSEPTKLRTDEWRLAVDFMAQAQNSMSTLQMLERAPSEGQDKTAMLIPIRFLYMNKLTRDDKLVLAFDALVLSQMVVDRVEYGKIVHGDNHTTLKVKTAALAKDLRTLVQKTASLIASRSPPDLILNRHCVECEFRTSCRQKAIEKDDLGLLAGMTFKERKTYNSKGIFTINSLSYTFRARRRPKGMAGKPEKYYHSLKALAIRNHKIHIAGRPEFKLEGTPVYLDVEALPDRDFYYLIGVRVKTADRVIQHSLWADGVDDERRIWTKFLAILSEVDEPLLIHYGSFETTFLKRMCQRYGELHEESIPAKAFRSAVNLLSVVFAQIYFPTYSNSLKDIASLAGIRLV